MESFKKQNIFWEKIQGRLSELSVPALSAKCIQEILCFRKELQQSICTFLRYTCIWKKMRLKNFRCKLYFEEIHISLHLKNYKPKNRTVMGRKTQAQEVANSEKTAYTVRI
jgi:hypothetical protein